MELLIFVPFLLDCVCGEGCEAEASCCSAGFASCFGGSSRLVTSFSRLSNVEACCFFGSCLGGSGRVTCLRGLSGGAVTLASCTSAGVGSGSGGGGCSTTG